ncbi:hypothetical protein R1flu_014981 [Riccia fluitans]|uniref:Uncharacterized protein n=1 Tax=Riccia fluitans TaxID=41844 RepID=A0ABD1YIH9_9MARC
MLYLTHPFISRPLLQLSAPDRSLEVLSWHSSLLGRFCREKTTNVAPYSNGGRCRSSKKKKKKRNARGSYTIISGRSSGRSESQAMRAEREHIKGFDLSCPIVRHIRVMNHHTVG